MKVTLEYNLPEEEQEFDIALNANKYYVILEELVNMCYSEDLHHVNHVGPISVKNLDAEKLLKIIVTLKEFYGVS